MRASMLLVAGLLLSTVSPAEAVVINVPGDYPTIQQAIDAAIAGDVVMVAAGHYPEEITLKSGVIVQGAGEGLSVIDGGGDSGDVVRAIGNDIGNDTKLIGFTITGAISGGSMPGGGGVFCNSGAAPEIRNNRIEGNDTGIATWNSSAAYIHNNVVVDNTYTAISLSSASWVVNNTVSGNTTGIYDSGGWGTTIMNNIVVNNSNIGIGAVNGSVPMDISYNDVWNNGTNYHNTTPDLGNISDDPLFADEIAGDYHLAAGSPCIDAGNPAPTYTDPDGTRNDMGAYGGPDAESNAPRVTLVDPLPNALGVPVDATVSAIFSVDMDPGTLDASSCVLRGAFTGAIPSLVTYDAPTRAVMIDPVGTFRVGEPVSVALTRDIQSGSGTAFGGYTWQFTAEVADGSGQLDTAAASAAGTSPRGITAGDFDADGVLDLAVSNQPANGVTVLLGAGSGTFAASAPYTVGSLPKGILAADLDDDGALDLAVADEGSNQISILLGLGDGSFAPAAGYPVGTSPRAIAAADLNLDGAVDLATANEVSGTVAVLLGAGDGSFGAASYTWAGMQPRTVRAADLDGDGAPDLVVVNHGAATISVLIGQGDGTFGPPSSFACGATPEACCVADLDLDGDLDVAVANSTPGTVSILRGAGDGSFVAAGAYGVGSGPVAIAAADLDADGRPDLVVTGSQSDEVSVLLGTGDATFAAAVSYVTGAAPLGLALADFDGDGDLDVCTADSDDGTVSFLANRDALVIVETDPAAHDLNVPAATVLVSTFNLAVDPGTLDGASFTASGKLSGPHPGVVSYDGGTYTATLDPGYDFVSGELVTATLTTEIRSGSGVDFDGHLWCFTVAVPTASPGEFGGLQDHATGSEPRGVFAADYDGDGDIDIAVTSSNYPAPGRVAIHENTGGGVFSGPAYYSLSAADPIAIYGADLDGDGDIDLAVAHNEPGSSHLSILDNNGDGSFVSGGIYAPAILGQDVWGGDLDADGDVDLIMTDGWGSSSNVHVLANHGDGTFAGAQTYTAGTFARGVKTADVDLDGDLDLAVASQGDNNLSVLLNDGAGRFGELANHPVGPGPGRLAANDFNGDGRIDVAAAGSGAVSVVLNSGGGFGAPASYSTTGSVRDVIGADLDGDGDIDLAAALADGDALWVLLNDGAGSFTPDAEYPTADGPWGLDVADVDADGDLDLVAAIFNLDRIEIHTNGPVVAVPEPVPYAGLAPGQMTIHPSPFRASAEIAYRLSAGTPGQELAVRIFDVHGRLVRVLTPLVGGDGVAIARWDGRDAGGRNAPAGVYFCRLAGEGTSRRVLRVR